MRYACGLFPLLPFTASGAHRTNARYLVNDAGERVKLSGVYRYGADQKNFVPVLLHSLPSVQPPIQ